MESVLVIMVSVCVYVAVSELGLSKELLILGREIYV